MIQTELEEAGLSVAAVTRRMNAERRANNRRGSSGRMMDGQDDKCDLSMLLEEEIDR